MPDVVDTFDSIGSTAGNLPRGRVLAYLTGGEGIAWTPAQISAATKRGDTLLRIDQSNSIQPYKNLRTLIKDIEPGASTAGTAVAEADERAAATLRTCFYVDLSDWDTVRMQVRGRLVSFVDYLIADWTGSREQAVTFIANHLRDGVIGVQYASPSAQPNMLIPGTRTTIARANVDLSVTLADWPTAKPAAPAPSKKPHRKVKAASATGAVATGILAFLNANGAAHVQGLTPAESSAITTILMALAAYFTPAKR